MTSTTYRFISPMGLHGALIGLVAALRLRNLAIVGAYVLVVTVVVAILAFISTTVSAEGVVIRHLAKRRSISWAEVAAAQLVNGKVQLSLHSGEAVTLPAPTTRTRHYAQGVAKVEQALGASRGWKRPVAAEMA